MIDQPQRRRHRRLARARAARSGQAAGLAGARSARRGRRAGAGRAGAAARSTTRAPTTARGALGGAGRRRAAPAPELDALRGGADPRGRRGGRGRRRRRAGARAGVRRPAPTALARSLEEDDNKDARACLVIDDRDQTVEMVHRQLPQFETVTRCDRRIPCSGLRGARRAAARSVRARLRRGGRGARTAGRRCPIWWCSTCTSRCPKSACCPRTSRRCPRSPRRARTALEGCAGGRAC